MIGVIALLGVASALDAQALPQLPERGLVRDTRAGIELQTMQGRPIGVIGGLNIAPDMATSRELLLRDRRGSLYRLDRRARRLRRISDGPPPRRECRVTDRKLRGQLIVCWSPQYANRRTSTIKLRTASGALRVVARAPGKVGHWERAAFAPRGDGFFAQWSAECEVPIAFYVANGRIRPFGASTLANAPSSMALGWLPNGSAVVHFPAGPCGKSQGAPGVYAVPIRGMVTLLVRTPRFERYWMWGG